MREEPGAPRSPDGPEEKPYDGIEDMIPSAASPVALRIILGLVGAGMILVGGVLVSEFRSRALAEKAWREGVEVWAEIVKAEEMTRTVSRRTGSRHSRTYKTEQVPYRWLLTLRYAMKDGRVVESKQAVPRPAYGLAEQRLKQGGGGPKPAGGKPSEPKPQPKKPATSADAPGANLMKAGEALAAGGNGQGPRILVRYLPSHPGRFAVALEQSPYPPPDWRGLAFFTLVFGGFVFLAWHKLWITAANPEAAHAYNASNSVGAGY